MKVNAFVDRLTFYPIDGRQRKRTGRETKIQGDALVKIAAGCSYDTSFFFSMKEMKDPEASHHDWTGSLRREQKQIKASLRH